MNGQTLKRWIEIIGLVLLTALVILAVLYAHKRDLLFPSAEPASETVVTQSESAWEDGSAGTTEEADISTTEWLPEIRYDDYVASEIDASQFRSTVILGNSQAQALSMFGLIPNADFVTKVGLSINHVLTSPDGEPAPITKLSGKTYRKAVFVFGENELGWPSTDNFVRIYKRVIARVREMNPGVEVYVQGIFPVTKEASEASTIGVTNENVVKFNRALETMCDEINAVFMPVSDAFRDSTGALPDGVARDGVHFGRDLCKVWAGDMSAYIGENTLQTETSSAPVTTTTTTEAATEPEKVTETEPPLTETSQTEPPQTQAPTATTTEATPILDSFLDLWRN